MALKPDVNVPSSDPERREAVMCLMQKIHVLDKRDGRHQGASTALPQEDASALMV